MKKNLMWPILALVGLILIFDQSNMSTNATMSPGLASFLQPQPRVVASIHMAQQPKIVMQDDETANCLVIDPNTNTFCWKFPDGLTFVGDLKIERLPITQTIIFGGDFEYGAVQGSVSLDSRFGSAEFVFLFFSARITDRNVDDSRCDCSADVDYSVNSLGDDPDANPGDGVCRTVSGHCTALAAIMETNATPGSEPVSIGFNGLSKGMNTLRPRLPYPTITRSRVTIDGTTHPNGWVILDGSNLPDGNANGLTFASSGNRVRGLEIRNFPGDGLRRETGGGSVLELLDIHDNGGNGMVILSRDNTIRYSNLWGNRGHGLALMGTGATGNRVLHCNIGTDGRSCTGPDGRSLGNGGEGINNQNAPGNMIGPGNVIGCNSDGGSIIGPDATGNTIWSNFIGTDLQCIQDLGNRGAGQGFADRASNNMVKDNVFAFNRFGVIGFRGTTQTLSENSMFSNTVLGIDLNFPGGVTGNDSGDRDGVLNFPELTAATQANSTNLRGRFNSRPSTTYQLEFFSNTMCHQAGNGEGQFFIGSTMATTNFLGNATLNITLPVTVPGGQFITATAIDPTGNTSEFSPCVRVSGNAQPDAELSMSVPAGLPCALEFFTYSITVRNNGNASALGTIVSHTLPECVIGSQITTSQGIFTIRGRTLTADFGTIDPGASATITIATSVVPDCAPGFSSSASVSVANDANVADNTVTVSTIVNCD